MSLNNLQQRILEIKKQKNALLLVHNYQIPEIQEIADELGDSLELCRKAQEAEDVDMIVFCGVDFMAETAKVLNPNKRVVIPSRKAVCPMASMLSMDALMKVKAKYPDAPVVLYVNTLAEAKAEATVICTSANADKVVRQLGAKQVIFGPDKNLGYFVNKSLPDVELIYVPEDGHCRVHRFIGNGDEAMELKEQHPDALVLDKQHRLPTGERTPVSGNTWRLLSASRFAPHFEFMGEGGSHRGIFTGFGEGLPFDAGRAAPATSGCC